MARYPNLDIIGQTGLSHSGGVINEEWLTKLSGDRAIKVYTEMRDNDAIVGSILYVCL